MLVPLQLDDGGFTPFAIGAVFLAAGLVETVVNPFLGRFSDRRGRLLPIRIALAASIVVALAFAARAATRTPSPLLTVLAAITFGAFYTPGMALVSDRTESAGLSQAIGFGIMNTAWALGNMTGPGTRGRRSPKRRATPSPTRSPRRSACSRSRRREPLEHPRRVQWPATVAPPVDERVVARSRIHRQPRLGGVPAVVALDQLVHLAEVPPARQRLPRLRFAAERLVDDRPAAARARP